MTEAEALTELARQKRIENMIRFHEALDSKSRRARSLRDNISRELEQS